MDEVPHLEQGPVFKDRKAELVVFGIVQLLAGCLSAVMGFFIVLSIFLSVGDVQAGGAIQIAPMLVGSAWYFGFAVWSAVIGIGSILARRWARVLALVTSWLVLACVVQGSLMALLMADILVSIGDLAGSDDSRAVLMIFIIVMVIIVIVAVIAPGVFILFYSGKNVKATCDYRDPKVRWTDRCPLPVLWMSLASAFLSIGLLSNVTYGGVFPFFGIVLQGIPGILMLLIVAGVGLWVAWYAYHLDSVAWYTAMVLIISVALSAIITFSIADFWEVTRIMGFPDYTINTLREMGLTPLYQRLFFVSPLVIGLMAVSYLLWVKKYFDKAAASDSPASPVAADS